MFLSGWFGSISQYLHKGKRARGNNRVRKGPYRLLLEPLEDRTLLSARFAVAPTVDAGFIPSAVAVADFNGDHIDDFAVTNQDGQRSSDPASVLVFLGNGNGAFQRLVSLKTTASQPVAMVVGDFQGDGKADLLVAIDEKTVNLFLGNGNGTFASPSAIALSGRLRTVAVGDFNGDTKLDFAVLYSSADSGAVLLGQGNGTFQSPQLFVTDVQPNSISVGDFNGDGKLDLATVNYSSGSTGNVSVLLGKGNGTFVTNATFGVGSDPKTLAVGDFNGDGKLDLASAGFSSVGSVETSVYVLLGSGDGDFSRSVPQVISTTSGVSSIATGDFNADGKLDLAIGDYNKTNMHVLLNTGNAAFNTARQYLLPSIAAVAVGDFNVDGKPDLLSVSRGGTGIASVLLGNGNGAFAAIHTVDTGTFSIAVADFNADGKLDIVATRGTETDNIRVFLNSGPDTFQAPRLSTVAMFTGLAHSMAPADLNGDGKTDLIVTSVNSVGLNAVPNIDVLLGAGDGTFGFATLFPTGSQDTPRNVATGDFNGDGKLDVAVTNGTGKTSSLSVLLGNGNGTFGPATAFAGNAYPSSLGVGDFNKDGKQDLVEVGQNVVGIFLSNGNGTFKAPSNTTADGVQVPPSAVSTVAAGDFNNDGKPDVAVVFKGGGSFGTFLGNGDGNLTAYRPIGGIPFPQAIAVGDVNGDGNQDLVVPGAASFNQPFGNLLVLLGNGNNTFAPSVFPASANPSEVQLGDFNGDGAADVAVSAGAATSTSEGISVFINTGPTITGFTPAGAPPGVSVTITGTDFVGVTAVAFNGTPTTNFTVISPTRITAVVPNGATTGPLGVAAADGVARSVAKFTVTVAVMTAFSTGPVGQFPTGLAVGDFNGDGKLDTAVANYGPTGGNSVSVLFGAGDGTFSSPTTTLALPAGTNPFGITTGKFTDGSNVLSIVTGNFSGQSVAVIQGNGDGTFKTPLILPAKDSANGLHKIVQVTVGDLNGDVHQDIVAASGDGTYTVFLGNGNGTFTALPSKSALTPIFGIAIANIDTGAGPKPSLIAAAFAAWKVAVLPGNGDGTFTGPIFSDAVGGQTDEFVATGDFNKDGKTDVAVSNKDSNSISVLLGNGNGTFKAATTSASGSTPLGITASDLNADGKLDIAAADLGSNAISIFLGNSNGTFAAANNYATGPFPIAVAAGNFKVGEGLPDLVAANFFGNQQDTITLATNNTPTIASFTPSSGPVGTQVVLFGTNFFGVNAVSFNGVSTTNFVINSPTQITVFVPTGASTGLIGVAATGGIGVSTQPFTVT